MNLHKRFVVQFFIQLFLLSLVSFLVILTVWGIIGFTLQKDEVQEDLSKADSSYFINRVSSDESGASIEKDLKDLAKSQEGWLILIQADGTVADSSNTPEKLPGKIELADIAESLWGDAESGEKLSYWEIEFAEKESLFLLYGRKNIAKDVLALVEPTIAWQNGTLGLTDNLAARLAEKNAWIQLIDLSGKVVDSYGNIKINSYTVKQLGELGMSNQSVAVSKNLNEELAVIVGTSRQSFSAWETTFTDRNLLLFALSLLVLIIGGTFWYARKFALPLLVMMRWIQNLGEGRYEKPVHEKNGSVIINKKGKIKRKYRLYKDLIETLEQLTEKLKLHQQQQKKMEKTREDWISGLSHDLKTPLSSISGYAQMLEAPGYEWSPVEMRKFASIMNEKSSYMMDLLEELTLTFRLKNQALPLAKEKVDVNEFVRRIVINFINDPSTVGLTFTFLPSPESLHAQIDPKWFQRIIDNLIANAVKYNPSGTKIKVSISAIEKHLFVIVIEDNGKGMETEMLDKLFDRYYRGTNTHDPSTGTGLGLAITKQLVQLHGGSIHIDSSVGKGTGVKLIVPV